MPMWKNLRRKINQETNGRSRHPGRRKPRSPGVILRDRSTGLHRYRDEIRADGGKRYLHHRARARGKKELRRLIADATETT